ncbi:DNA-binding protein [Massilia sp. KIM]|uniref:MocR-like pyridoxine biosynthesis transcription factor PdxR n=1 Tax=Massilia sp. KIM TaxID=1955422 RepID=UPI000990132E|nr:PLP-dependent aminotransferase family protein [Massilia sp. KIM]OON60822.1 DNA-binding protein [Massilia sp. KIM]
MELHLLLEGRKDLAGQLFRQLREAIRGGRLADGVQLPPSRLLASQLGVSRKTVAEAYLRLARDGYVSARVGAGSFVRATPQAAPRPVAAGELAGAATLARWASLERPLHHAAPAGQSRYEFIGGAVAHARFPHEAWRRCLLRALRSPGAPGRYGEAEGLPALRQAIARHAGFTRGVRCTASDVVVTAGAQQALDLIARVLVEPGCTVAMEEPGYPPARLLFASQGATVVGVPVDEEGIVPERIPEGVRLVYVTPAHQFPLGMAMSAPRRRALLERARAIGAVVIEDDYDSAFRYGVQAADSLQSMDRHGIVAYVGTFSKVLLPELRCGYLIAPPAILQAVAAAKHLSDWHVNTLTQGALADFIDSGELGRHIRRVHAVYAARRKRLLARLDGDLAPWLEALPADCGLHVAALFRRPVDLPALLRLARRVEVGLYPLDGFYTGPARQGLLFGLGAIEVLDIDPALDRLAAILGDSGEVAGGGQA